MTSRKPTQERLRELLDYDPETGIVRWRERLDSLGRRHECSGTISGTRKEGEIQIRVDGKFYRLHQIIWVWMTGVWVPKVDHEDGKFENNRWNNLREATSSQNNCNRHVVAGDVHFKGVYFHKGRNKFAAQIKKNKKWEWLGLYETAEKAAKAYDERCLILHGDFAVTNKILGLL